MITTDIEHRGAGTRRPFLEGIPLRIELCTTSHSALDQVANIHNQLRPQQRELLDGNLEDSAALTPGKVGEDGERKLVIGCVEVFVCPGFDAV